jgi:hypothetical protein
VVVMDWNWNNNIVFFIFCTFDNTLFTFDLQSYEDSNDDAAIIGVVVDLTGISID